MIRPTIFLVLAVILNVSVGMTFRHKRQSNDGSDNNLDDRYGSDRPSWDRPRRPSQWFRPNQGGSQWGQTNQNGNQWGQQPNQNGNQWGQSNQNGNQWGQSNQNGNQQPNQGGNQAQSTPAPSATGSSTTESQQVQDCIRSCPVTPEYNPVCGTNQVQYNNPGRLECARNCGVNVSLQRAGACPAAAS